MGTSRPKKEDKAFYRLLEKNWRGFVAGFLTVLVPIASAYYMMQKDKWDELDQSVTVLVNTVIDLDSVPPPLQPEIAAPRSGRIKFVREYQSKNHPNEWHLFEKQIPFVSENSDLTSHNRAVAGHRSVGQRVHGVEQFAKAELRQRTDLIERGFDGEAFNSPLSLLAHVQTGGFDQLIPASESDVQVRWLLVSDRRLRSYEDTPRIDLSDPRVIELLKKVGVDAAAFSETSAVPALTEISDSAYQVETVAVWR